MRPTPGLAARCLTLIAACFALTACTDDGQDALAPQSQPTVQPLDSGVRCSGRGETLETLPISERLATDGGTVVEWTLVEADPLPAIVGNNSWLFSLTLEGELLTGLGSFMTFIPFMPDHGHGTAIPVTVSEPAPGRYRFEPVHMRMAGYWEHTIVIQHDDLEAEVVFAVCLE